MRPISRSRSGDLPQGEGQLLPADGVAHQFPHRPQAAADGRRGEQGPLHPRPDQPVAHGGAGLVQHPQQAPLLLLGAQRLGQLQVAPGGEIQLHELPGGEVRQGGEVGQVGLLGLIEVGQQAAHRLEGGVVPGGQGVQAGGELLLRRRAGRVQPEAGLAPVLAAAVQALDQEVHQGPVAVRPVGEHGLPRGEAAQLVIEVLVRLRPGEGGDGALAGGDVAEAQPRARAVPVHGADEVVAPLLQHGGGHHRAGGDDADDVPVHQPLGQGGVLHLLADGHLVALGDQPGDVGVGAVVGHAAHGGALRLRLAPVPAGQGQLQLLGYQLGVLVEHLVKITQPEKQNTVRVQLLHAQVLLHHGRGLWRHSVSPVLSLCVVAIQLPAQGVVVNIGPDAQKVVFTADNMVVVAPLPKAAGLQSPPGGQMDGPGFHAAYKPSQLCGGPRPTVCGGNPCVRPRPGSCGDNPCGYSRLAVCGGNSCGGLRPGSCGDNPCGYSRLAVCGGNSCGGLRPGSCGDNPCGYSRLAVCGDNPCGGLRPGPCRGGPCGRPFQRQEQMDMVGHDNLVLHPYPGKRDGLCHTFPQRGENEGRATTRVAPTDGGEDGAVR